MMLRALICGGFLYIAAVTAAAAQAWEFHYGPDTGGAPLNSYAQVSAGRNLMSVHFFGDQGNVALSALLDTFEVPASFEQSLEAGEPVVFAVQMEDQRYGREITKDDYYWQKQQGEDKSLILFLLNLDDMAAIHGGKAVFVQVGSNQFRFGTDNADDAMVRMIRIVKDDID